QSIIDGWHTVLGINRYPVAALYITVDPYLIDVNVHPTKLEVRFSKEDELYASVVSMLKDHFQKENHFPVVNKQSLTSGAKKPEQRAFDWQAVATQKPKKEAYQPVSSTFVEPVEVFEEETSAPAHAKAEEEIPHVVDKPAIDTDMLPFSTNSTHQHVSEAVDPFIFDEEVPHEVEKERLPSVEFVGQVHGTYWVLQNETGMYLMDQHAAQERINYEYFYEKLGQENKGTQMLMLPLVISYSTAESLQLEKKCEKLTQMGIDIEHYGGNDWIVRGYPTWMSVDNPEEMLSEIIAMLLQHGEVNQHKIRENLSIMMSCKASIKANQFVTIKEIQHLYEQLRNCKQPFTCPHGRPIMVHFTTYEIEKMFKRA
ncbi:MAG: DNA mismatch repair endonuclease MutL, partial [Bacilli bacterium]